MTLFLHLQNSQNLKIKYKARPKQKLNESIRSFSIPLSIQFDLI